MNILIVLTLPLLLLALLIRTFAFQPFNIPSSSMAPTLMPGDHIFVSKFAYGYSRYSLPFTPIRFSGRILGASPAYGDAVAYQLPKDDTTTFLGRVVGLPGDRLQVKQGLLHINGKAVGRERAPDLTGVDVCGSSGAIKRWRERLPNGVAHETLDCVDNGFYDNTVEYVVPAGHYFLMGDNRDNSTDSRVLSQVGYVPYDNFVGRYAIKCVRGTDANRQ